MNWKDFAKGLMIGGALGAGMALLFAPQEGSATRKSISSAAHTVGDRMSGIANNVGEKAHEAAKAIKQAI